MPEVGKLAAIYNCCASFGELLFNRLHQKTAENRLAVGSLVRFNTLLISAGRLAASFMYNQLTTFPNTGSANTMRLWGETRSFLFLKRFFRCLIRK
jgi:hypothetical protein